MKKLFAAIIIAMTCALAAQSETLPREHIGNRLFANHASLQQDNEVIFCRQFPDALENHRRRNPDGT